MAQLVGALSHTKKVAGPTPGQGTFKRQTIDVSLKKNNHRIKIYPWVKIFSPQHYMAYSIQLLSYRKSALKLTQ